MPIGVVSWILVKSIFGEDAYHTTDLTRVTASDNWNTGGFLPSYVLDGRLETSWKPSQGNLKDEWIEIDFGGEGTVSQVKIRGNEDIALKRVPILKGETRSIEFEIPAKKLRHFDSHLNKYVVEKGKYKLFVGAASNDIRKTILVDVN